MSDQRLGVGVVIEKRKAASPWIDHLWNTVTVLPGLPDTLPMTPLGRSAEGERFYLGAAEITLFAGDTGNYRENLTSGAPRIWVALGLEPLDGSVVLRAVTADPAEGEALAGSESNIVDAVAMPPEIGAVIEAFVAQFHVERPFHKRKRDRADPDSLGHRRPGEGDRR